MSTRRRRPEADEEGPVGAVVAAGAPEGPEGPGDREEAPVGAVGPAWPRVARRSGPKRRSLFARAPGERPTVVPVETDPLSGRVVEAVDADDPTAADQWDARRWRPW